MASWMVHLRIADTLLDKVPDLDNTAFIVGNIAPDSGVPSEDWSYFTPDTFTSHFKITQKDGTQVICLSKYVDQYFTRDMRSTYDDRQYSFYLGYYVHLLSDILWAQEIVNPSIAADRISYETDPAAAVWKWKKDWYDLDFLYLRDHSDFRAFRIYEQAEGFENEFMDIFSRHAFDNRRKYITGFYHEKQDNLDREYPWLSKEKMDAFVEKAVRIIEKEIKIL